MKAIEKVPWRLMMRLDFAYQMFGILHSGAVAAQIGSNIFADGECDQYCFPDFISGFVFTDMA
jgi:hypothetical protein